MEKTSIALTGGPEERKEADREGKEEEDPGREMPTSGHWGNEWRQTEVTRRSHRAHSDHLFDHVYNLVILFHSIQCCWFVFIRETAKQMLEWLHSLEEIKYDHLEKLKRERYEVCQAHWLLFFFLFNLYGIFCTSHFWRFVWASHHQAVWNNSDSYMSRTMCECWWYIDSGSVYQQWHIRLIQFFPSHPHSSVVKGSWNALINWIIMR